MCKQLTALLCAQSSLHTHEPSSSAHLTPDEGNASESGAIGGCASASEHESSCATLPTAGADAGGLQVPIKSNESAGKQPSPLSPTFFGSMLWQRGVSGVCTCSLIRSTWLDKSGPCPDLDESCMQASGHFLVAWI